MFAIAPNLIIRYLTGDHPRQSARARALIDGNGVFVSATVLLETEWVLRSVYEFTMAEVSKALRDFAGLARVTIEDSGVVAQALDWMDAGIDFADALHLAKAGACDAFITFDERLARAAKRLGTVKARAP